MLDGHDICEDLSLSFVSFVSSGFLVDAPQAEPDFKERHKKETNSRNQKAKAKIFWRLFRIPQKGKVLRLQDCESL